MYSYMRILLDCTEGKIGDMGEKVQIIMECDVDANVREKKGLLQMASYSD